MTRHHRGFTCIHPSGLPQPVTLGWNKGPWALSSGFAPRGYPRRTPRWGQALHTGLGPPLDSSRVSLVASTPLKRPHVATAQCNSPQGFTDLHSYLAARARQQASPAQLASELRATTKVVRRLLDQAGFAPSPRQVTAAHRRRSSTDQHLAARADDVWLTLVLVAQTLVAWAQALLLDGELARAEPKTLRYRLWHAAARLVRHPARVAATVAPRLLEDGCGPAAPRCRDQRGRVRRRDSFGGLLHEYPRAA